MNIRTALATLLLALTAISAGAVASDADEKRPVKWVPTAHAAPVHNGNDTTPPPPALPFWMKTPCEFEDSYNCYWNAGRAGNGGGHSFYVRMFPGRGRVYCLMYVEFDFARRNDICGALTDIAQQVEKATSRP